LWPLPIRKSNRRKTPKRPIRASREGLKRSSRNRTHHLLKTFWTGATGWTDQQLPDGTILWTAPTGHQYRSPPGSRLLFAHWDTATPSPPINPASGPPPTADRNLAMPLRIQTRTAEHAARIRRERQRNQAIIDSNSPPS